MTPITTIIFDLSEVLIPGVIGIEKGLAPRLHIPMEDILPAFCGQLLHEICCGSISEEEYLARILEQQHWPISSQEIKTVIRENFHQRGPGMESILRSLVGNYDLVLLSDHAFEWIEYIHQIHPFLAVFAHQFFSYQIKQTKDEASTFVKVLAMLQKQPEECFLLMITSAIFQTPPVSVSAGPGLSIPGNSSMR